MLRQSNRNGWHCLPILSLTPALHLTPTILPGTSLLNAAALRLIIPLFLLFSSDLCCCLNENWPFLVALTGSPMFLCECPIFERRLQISLPHNCSAVLRCCRSIWVDFTYNYISNYKTNTNSSPKGYLTRLSSRTTKVVNQSCADKLLVLCYKVTKIHYFMSQHQSSDDLLTFSVLFGLVWLTPQSDNMTQNSHWPRQIRQNMLHRVKWYAEPKT